MNPLLSKKIIAGKYKGKTLRLPSKTTTRSSKAIVLESLFNTLQFEIIDATFVEVFAGSGSIGLEALSRGAKRILFMERDTQAIATLRHNIAQTDPRACVVFAGDSFITITEVVRALHHESAFFYIDPPFSYREGMEHIYDQMLTLIASLPRTKVRLCIIEHMSTLELPTRIGSFEQRKHKRFGKTSLTYYA